MVPVQVWVTVVPLVEDTVTCPDGGVDAAAGTARAARAATGTSNAQVRMRGRVREVMAGLLPWELKCQLPGCGGERPSGDFLSAGGENPPRTDVDGEIARPGGIHPQAGRGKDLNLEEGPAAGTEA